MFGVCFFPLWRYTTKVYCQRRNNIYLKLIDIMGDNYNLFSQFFQSYFCVFTQKPPHSLSIKKQLHIHIRRVWRYQREVITIRISKKNRQHNDQKKKYKRTNNDLQNTYKTKNRVTRTPLKTGGELRCSEGWAVPAPLVTPVVLI